MIELLYQQVLRETRDQFDTLLYRLAFKANLRAKLAVARRSWPAIS